MVSQKGGLLVLVGAILVVVAFAATLTYTSSPPFCGETCHWMSTRYVTWQHSTHGGVKCMDCHSEPGFVGEMQAHINGLRYLGPVITGELTEPIIKAEVSDASCNQCHEEGENPLWREFRITSGVQPDAFAQMVVHGAHLQGGARCMDCHENLVHRAFRLREPKPEKETCVKCHQGEGVIAISTKSW
jgi:nitrate/TMAO reductase-like tetraheme cytochrome c subunit